MISLYNNTISIDLCNKILYMYKNISQSSINTSSGIIISSNDCEWKRIYNLINNELSAHLKTYLINKNICATFLEYDQFLIKMLEQSNDFYNDEHIDYYDMKHSAISFILFLQEGSIEFDNKTIEASPGSLLLFPCNWAYSYKVCKQVCIVYGRLYVSDNIYAQKRVEGIINQLQSK